ncbi:hypothetical protein ABH915_000378 [Arthrobacter sp. MW3 TE3886]
MLVNEVSPWAAGMMRTPTSAGWVFKYSRTIVVAGEIPLGVSCMSSGTVAGRKVRLFAPYWKMRGSTASAVPPMGRPRPDMLDCPTARKTWRVEMTVAACAGTIAAATSPETTKPIRKRCHRISRGMEADLSEGNVPAAGAAEFGGQQSLPQRTIVLLLSSYLGFFLHRHPTPAAAGAGVRAAAPGSGSPAVRQSGSLAVWQSGTVRSANRRRPPNGRWQRQTAIVHSNPTRPRKRIDEDHRCST